MYETSRTLENIIKYVKELTGYTTYLPEEIEAKKKRRSLNIQEDLGV